LLKHLLLVAVFVVGCRRGLPDRLDKAPEMEAALVALAPLGTPLPEAVRRVSGAGFRCNPVQRNKWAGIPDSFAFAYCNASSTRGLIESRHWQVALADSAGTLGRVYVTVGTIMP
jgi:hypothetical protein